MRSRMGDGDTVAAVIGRDLAADWSTMPEHHAGRWVALSGQRVVAIGDSARDVSDAATARGVHDPVVLRVPEAPDRVAFF